MSYDYINSTGTVQADTSDTLATIKAEWQRIFGQDLDLSPQTPQGMMMAAQAIGRDTILKNNAAVANQINPNLAGGVFLDDICALTGMQRIAQAFTQVTCTVAGVEGTVIAKGKKAADANGNQYQAAADITLSGPTTSQWLAVNAGALACPAGTLTQIVDGVLGWETITNPVDGVVGYAQQSDASVRNLRRKTLALQGSGTAISVSSALWALPNVQSALVLENASSAPAVVQGVSMTRNSICCIVNGGLDADVANTILTKKSGGCGTSFTCPVATTTVNVSAVGGQIVPINFCRASQVPVQIEITVPKNSKSTIQSDILYAVAQYASGNVDGQDGFILGASVSPYELAAAVSAQIPGVYIANCRLTRVSNNALTNSTVAINPWEVAITSDGLVNVVLK
ncbi:baseplate J/gp47 family protein [Limnohabitans sp.]|uniref:baseplate J/gp47 family protein n=1 Tax=Limnohabitans sp. TaxID=1907725 RepID=UPI00286F50AD|nr:baseplate J/gp47 family protein [Limnohabitans sp.]